MYLKKIKLETLFEKITFSLPVEMTLNSMSATNLNFYRAQNTDLVFADRILVG